MDFSALGNETQVEGDNFKPEPPCQVAGRVLHFDADFLAYHSGYKWETESLAKSIETLNLEVESLRLLAGAQLGVLHLTMGDKGGRYEIAKVKEYQAQRKKAEGLAERVGALREYMVTCDIPGITSKKWEHQEADDGVCQAMIAARNAGTEAVMWSLDKDLWMVPGLHLNNKTFELEDYPCGYGYTEIDESGSTKKLVGRGYSFFWHQLLMGDTADNIPGLPKLAASQVAILYPNKKLVTAQERVATAMTTGKAQAARVALLKVLGEVKPKAVGAVTAYDMLKGCTTDRAAFLIVRDAYQNYYGRGKFTFVDWRGNSSEECAGSMLLEQGRLLWMRRYPGEDVIEFFKEVMA